MTKQNKPKKITKHKNPKVKQNVKPKVPKKLAPKCFDFLLDIALNFKPKKTEEKK